MNEHVTELFAVDVDLRTILGNIDITIRGCDLPLSKQEEKIFQNHVQEACKVLMKGLQRKLLSSQDD